MGRAHAARAARHDGDLARETLLCVQGCWLGPVCMKRSQVTASMSCPLRCMRLVSFQVEVESGHGGERMRRGTRRWKGRAGHRSRPRPGTLARGAARSRGRRRDRRRHLRRLRSRPSPTSCRPRTISTPPCKRSRPPAAARSRRSPTSARFPSCRQAVDAGLAELGRIDIVCANAGIGTWAVAWEMTAQQWNEMVDINLTGVFNTVRAALPSMVERGEGGSLVLTSSTAGLRAYQNTAHYTAAKHGVIGLMKVLAQECGPHGIRVNAVCPTTVRTPLVINDSTFELFAPDVENPSRGRCPRGVRGAEHPSGRGLDRARATCPMRCCSSARTPPSTSPASPSRSTPATP